MAELKLWTRPDSYIGETFEGFYVGPKKHRDSDTIQRSNFDASLKMLGGESRARGVVVANSSHWAVGWMEEIFVSQKAKKKVAILQGIADKIEGYPVLDEDLYQRYETESYDDHYKDYGRDEALKILGLEGRKLTEKQETDLWRAWSDAQSGSSDDPSTDERTLKKSAKSAGLA